MDNNTKPLTLGLDNICPVSKEPCDDECCSIGSVCNMSENVGAAIPDDNKPLLTAGEIYDKHLSVSLRNSKDPLSGYFYINAMNEYASQQTEALQAKLKDVTAEAWEHAIKAEALQAELDKLATICASQNHSNRELVSEKEALSENLRLANKQIEALQAEVETLRLSYNTAIEEDRILTEEKKSLKAEVEKLKETNSLAFAHHRSEITERDKEVERLKIESSKFAYECDRAKDDRNKAERRNTQLEEALMECKTQTSKRRIATIINKALHPNQ